MCEACIQGEQLEEAQRRFEKQQGERPMRRQDRGMMFPPWMTGPCDCDDEGVLGEVGLTVLAELVTKDPYIVAENVALAMKYEEEVERQDNLRQKLREIQSEVKQAERYLTGCQNRLEEAQKARKRAEVQAAEAQTLLDALPGDSGVNPTTDQGKSILADRDAALKQVLSAKKTIEHETEAIRKAEISLSEIRAEVEPKELVA